jgi:6-phosphogluconate dehydrogenase
MVHNGIEYGDMQLIVESAVLLRQGLGLEPAVVADVFSKWGAAELESYLIEITADIFRTEDPVVPGGLLLDAVLDRAGQKGTGRWTIQAALDLGVTTPTMSAAVDARVLSAQVELRAEAEAVFEGAGIARPPERLEGISADDLRDALYASKIASYSQGFDLLGTASAERGYETDLGEIARIWKAGCIIRARFLDRVRAVYAGSADSAPSVLALAPDFATDLVQREQAWRRVVGSALSAGLPVPGLAASLTWFDGLRTARGSATVIQAQRDSFGSHTYERLDTPGEAVHSTWKPAS